MIGCVTATDDFEGQEAVDLAFVKGETIFLQKLVDENWGEGQIGNDRQGIFPLTFTNYAELRDIPVEQRPPSPNKQRDFSVGAQGTIVKNVKHGNLEIGDLVNVLSRDDDVFWVEDRKKNIIPVPYNMIELKTGRKSTEPPNLRNGNQQRQSPTTRGFLDKTKSTLEKKLKRASWSPDKSPILDLGLEIANFGIRMFLKIFSEIPLRKKCESRWP
ncbi:Oidioi.mRNA.OKI2018_I69.chr2.g6704.t1.cds [Oikopleura dioica]|uniref:Oidioi.mRNA.OKI2018_I69.chr2.g6704.t1.cds n=1 Tax=Oikopleura dioica TaxID=34765 RepID=A0ABN7T4T9_OIKDI|nr:Oidioi.mRNA.OKI2018_I69.chr2.g6704.t1.cds [Oikopleura dioica]